MIEKTIDENIKEAAKEETSAAFKWVPCSERLPSNKHEQLTMNAHIYRTQQAIFDTLEGGQP